MKILNITKPFPTAKGLMQPGEYRIPADVSLTLAKCARADGYGEIVETANFRKTAKPSRKTPAPENKALGSSPESKTDLGEPDGDSGGERTESQRRPSRSRASKRSADTGGQ